MRYFFHCEQWLPYPVEFVFAFFANPHNLPRLMPAWQKAVIEQASFASPPPDPNLSVLAPTRKIAAGCGTRMTLSFRPVPYSPFRLSWEAEITEFAWNDHFCDVQLSGPFAYWRHCHRLQDNTRDGKSGTLLTDEVEYEMRFGVIGEVAPSFLIRWQFQKMFNYRHKRTVELLRQSN